MNIQDRIAKLEKELSELKESYMKDVDAKENTWKPRVGEICEFSDDEDMWIISRLVEVKDSLQEYPYSSTHEDFRYCRPLNDPMVIQLIPHVPGDPMPCGKDKDVITLHGNEFAEERYYCASAAGESHWDMCDSDSDVFGWFPLNED